MQFVRSSAVRRSVIRFSRMGDAKRMFSSSFTPKEGVRRIGVYGGSGMYDIEGITVREEFKLDTPFGAPSCKYTIATVEGVDNVEVVFQPRHGKGHIHTPSEVNFRANVYGMKKLGVSWALSVTAVGSLQMEYPPGDMVLVNQFIDRTQHRQATFFGNGIVSHVPFGDPICHTARELLRQACEDSDVVHHVSISSRSCSRENNGDR